MNILEISDIYSLLIYLFSHVVPPKLWHAAYILNPDATHLKIIQQVSSLLVTSSFGWVKYSAE